MFLFIFNWFYVISIHAPARGASAMHRLMAVMAQFQFTPLREGLPFFTFTVTPGILFQFTPLREGLLFSRLFYSCSSKFQFTPLREGLLVNQFKIVNCLFISIHAPARGASGLHMVVFDMAKISIHAPARGASSRSPSSSASFNNFNSRPCERGFQVLR